MGGSYGTQTIETLGKPFGVLAVPSTARWKPGGVTIDWSTVTAVSGSAVDLNDGITVPVGKKYLRYGTILTRITASGKYGPANTNGGTTDGRQTVTNAVRGESFILNSTLLEDSIGSDIATGVFDGGTVFRDRLLIGGTDQPTEANVETMFPGITFIDD